MEEIVTYLVETIGSLGYIGIFVLMFLESSCFPFPSEVVMVPAGYLSYKGEMNLVLALFAGILGSLAGALFNYFIATSLRREFLLKYGRYVFITEKTLNKVDLFFQNHGEIATFNGRLLPGIRQYISLPAGVARMSLTKFSLYTSLGAGIWVLVLILLGYFLGANEMIVKKYLKIITLAAICLVIVITVVYLLYRRKKGKTVPIKEN
jgi:membrane protein DedA with SNARE-associated domain